MSVMTGWSRIGEVPLSRLRSATSYALERLAQNNPAQWQTMVDVICAYLRMPFALPEDKPPAEDAAAEAHARYEQRCQELQVRLTAQRILAAHLKPTAVDTFWPDIDLDLTGAHLHHLDLTHCHMRHAQSTRGVCQVNGVTGSCC
jgi:hypothetical protein